jgi:hypothetical protein
MAYLAQKPSKDLHEFMHKVEKYINQEETLRAFLGLDQSQASALEKPKKKKDNREDNSSEYK